MGWDDPESDQLEDQQPGPTLAAQILICQHVLKRIKKEQTTLAEKVRIQKLGMGFSGLVILSLFLAVFLGVGIGLYYLALRAIVGLTVLLALFLCASFLSFMDLQRSEARLSKLDDASWHNQLALELMCQAAGIPLKEPRSAARE